MYIIYLNFCDFRCQLNGFRRHSTDCSMCVTSEPFVPSELLSKYAPAIRRFLDQYVEALRSRTDRALPCDAIHTTMLVIVILVCSRSQTQNHGLSSKGKDDPSRCRGGASAIFEGSRVSGPSERSTQSQQRPAPKHRIILNYLLERMNRTRGTTKNRRRQYWNI